MEKSTFTPLYELFRSWLVGMRQQAGLTQRELARRLGREHSLVARVELGERRLDVVELYWICQACDVPPSLAMRRLAELLEEADASLSRHPPPDNEKVMARLLARAKEEPASYRAGPSKRG